MVKFATDITVEERKRDYLPESNEYQVVKSISIALHENKNLPIAERFPYVAAILRNSSKNWTFSCFASVVLVKWIVTSARCRRKGATHRVLLLNDFAHNLTRSFPILFWRVHEKFHIDSTAPFYDIAVAKFNVDNYPFTIKPSTFDERSVSTSEAAIWKTVSTMDRTFYLINDCDKIQVKITSPSRCYESYGISFDASLICIDLTNYDDCFIHEFGPIYNEDKLVGVLAVKPRDCDVKYAVFTNVSHYTTWILKLTHTTSYG